MAAHFRCEPNTYAVVNKPEDTAEWSGRPQALLLCAHQSSKLCSFFRRVVRTPAAWVSMVLASQTVLRAVFRVPTCALVDDVHGQGPVWASKCCCGGAKATMRLIGIQLADGKERLPRLTPVLSGGLPPLLPGCCPDRHILAQEGELGRRVGRPLTGHRDEDGAGREGPRETLLRRNAPLP